ncbi:MAG: M48 family metalloprotease, partial [Pseudomonadales bacterium]
MDFFEAQDAARRKTAWLGVLFLGAVLSLIALTNAAVGMALTVASEGKLTLSTLPPSRWVIISSGVLVIIFIGSAIQAFRLRAGGASVARTLGGRLVTEETPDPLARRAQNIVEEMALAAGIPVPPLYIIPEAGINAFAAGFGLKDAVIGINQGTLEALNRDELQGVIAHEFSHIVNGDMGINIRLMALLHGILMISVAGRVLMHARGSGRQRDSAAQVVALGFALLVIGYSGVVFWRR